MSNGLRFGPGATIALVLALGTALAGPAFPAVQFPDPSVYTLLADDPTEVNNDCQNPRQQGYRDLDKVYIYDDQANHRIFIRYEYYGDTGFPNPGTGIFKWAIDTGGEEIQYQSFTSGTQILNHEYLLFVWDRGNAQNRLGEVNLAYQGPDGAEDGYPDTVVIGPTTACGSNCVGTGQTALGGLQFANNSEDIGYRLQGKVAELYVSYSALGSTDGTNPVTGLFELCPIGVGEATATNGNLNQASACDSTVNAIGNIELGIVCGGEPATLTIVKDTVPDLATAEFNFAVEGRSQRSATLQDPGTSECDDPNEWAACGTVPPWDDEDRVSFEDIEGSNHNFEPPIPYSVTESAGDGATFEAFITTWECRNVDPTVCTPEFVRDLMTDPDSDPFTHDECDPIDPLVRCEANGWTGGVASGEGPVTDDFDICMSAHVVCQFTNVLQECVAAEQAIADLQAIGGVEGEPAGFTTAAVPLRTASADDSIVLASFIPLGEEQGAYWPGMLDHFILPLPLVANDTNQLVPDVEATCTDAEAEGCVAWRASEAILEQAPAAGLVGTDRRIGTADTQRRVTYATHTGSGVPRTIRPFDWSDSDVPATEFDLWDAFTIPYTPGTEPEELATQSEARSIAHNTINETLQIKQVTITDNDAPDGTAPLDFVLGALFHSDPVVVAAPANFFYLATDLEGNEFACDDTVNPNKGYRCFWEKNQRRRRVVVGASNEGQVHAFDAGQFSGEVIDERLEDDFTRGTGKELFAHVPRSMMLHTQLMTETDAAFRPGIDGALVVDDVFIDPVNDGIAPTTLEREWRSVVLGTYREGQRGVFALDVTQPDPIDLDEALDEWVPASVGVVPGCAALGGPAPSGCGTLSYPAELWEFQDLCQVTSSSGAPTGSTSCHNDQLWDFDAQCLAEGEPGAQSFAVACDEDENGEPDLGYSWSQVNTGRIRVNVGGEEVVKFVALFGGGLDPEDHKNVGNFLYMVDIETGKAIYKRALDSAAASEPAAVDTNQDGIIDTLYIGTLDYIDPVDQQRKGGLMYKVDMSEAADVNPSTGRIDNPAQWAPFVIFDTGGRSIFFPPTITFVASLGKYALAFGTGDREDLFSEDLATQTGRFYMILDQDFQPGTGVLEGGPLTESSFQQIDALADGTNNDFLTAPLEGRQPGWVLQLAANERVVGKALTVSGLMVFSTFRPLTEDVCEFSGNGSIYSLLATNANSIAGVTEDRAFTDEGFFGEAVITPLGTTTAGSNGGEPTDQFDLARIQAIRDNLKDLFPADCRFGNFNLNVSVSLSNTSVRSVASIPICVAPKNWTEHF